MVGDQRSGEHPLWRGVSGRWCARAAGVWLIAGVVACASKQPATPSPARPAAAKPAADPPPGGASLKLAAKQGTGSAAGLTVTVLEVVEKYMNDGGTRMRVKLHVRPAGAPAPSVDAMEEQRDSVVTLTSEPGGAVASWRGFRIEYLGDWRTEVNLRISPPAAAK